MESSFDVFFQGLNSLLITVTVILLLTVFYVFIFYFGSKAYIWYLRFKNRARDLSKKTILKIQIEDSNENKVEVAEQIFNCLSGLRKKGFKNSLKEQDHVSFEVVADKRAINYYVVCPNHLKDLIEKQINAVYPTAEVTEPTYWNIFEKEGIVNFSSLVLAKEDYIPVKTYSKLTIDFMTTLTSSMGKLSEDEGLAFQMLVRPATSNWQDQGKSFVKSFIDKKNKTDKDGKPIGSRMTKADDEFVEEINKKIGKPGFETTIRLVSVAKDEASAKNNLTSLERAFFQLNSQNHNKFRKGENKFDKYFVISFLARMFPVVKNITLPFGIYKLLDKDWATFYSILNTEELATLWHLPNSEVKTPKINWLRSKGSAAPIDLPVTGIYLGKSEFRGQEMDIKMEEEDRRRHMYILGTTGTGKTELQKFMAIQDIKDGKGVGFIDPHGSAVQDIVQQIPKERMKDVIYFDPSSDRPMGLNILDVKTEKERDQVVNRFIEMLYELYDPNKQGVMGPQLERALRNCMLTAMSKPGGTMVDVVRLLISTTYYKNYLDYISDPMVKSYWIEEMANTTKNRRGETMGYFVSKLDRFVTEKTMRYMLGQPKSAFDFQDIMDKKKILLVDLSKGKLGEENSKFLGLLLIPRILAAAFTRIEKLERGETIEDFYLYIDEFQNYTTPDIETILSEARKYKLNLIVANQFIKQLPEKIKDAIFGNVGTISIFRIGLDDAEYLEKYFSPTFTKADLINNRVGRAYMKLLVKGQPSTPFAMRTDWSMMENAPRDKEQGDKIKEMCRQKYGRNRFIVEQEIAAVHKL